MPFDGEPTDVVARVVAYDQWLSSTPDVPKLLCTFDESPTMMLTPAELAWCEKNITGLETSPCGAAGHQVLEDQPAAVAAAISGWADRHHLRR
jgi:haloalkane dehalogenase